MNRAHTMRGLAFEPNLPLRVALRDGLPRPVPSAGEVLVRVTHTTVNGHEFALASHWLTRAMGWLRGAPGRVRTGLEFAGVVESPGRRFDEGQRVMGYVDMVAGHKPHAEYIAISEDCVVRMPNGLTASQAACLPMGAQTALVAVRDVAKLRQGHRLLVLGASGGVGVHAVQIARILGVHTTAMARGVHKEALLGLGAQAVVDYRETPLEGLSERFNAVIDLSSTAWLRDVRHVLADGAVFVPADPIRNLWDVLRSRQARWLMVDKGNAEHLEQIVEWVEQGQLRPVVSDRFAIDEWKQAVVRSHERGRLGRTVLSFGPAQAGTHS